MSAWVIAARSESGPESFVFRTVIVLGTTRSSSGSNPHTRRLRRVAARPDLDPILDTIRTLIDPEHVIGLSLIEKRVRASRQSGVVPRHAHDDSILTRQM
jgi:hypothetical protein